MRHHDDGTAPRYVRGLPDRTSFVSISHCTAPSYDELRPFKPTVTPTFPVYPDLTERMLKADSHPDDTLAHVLAACSGYAYSDCGTVATIMARMGLEECHCLEMSASVDAMFIRSTVFLVQSRDGRVVVVCYRGTEPDNLVNWLTDLDIYPERVPVQFPGGAGEFDVHGGFYRNVRATRVEVVAALGRAMEGSSIRPGGGRVAHACEALYLTGHSLGGALAALLGVMLVTEPEYRPFAERLRGVYTYGQPMVGDPAMARAGDAHPFLGSRVIRYVYGNDVVTRLSPKPAGPFAHFGREYRCRAGVEPRHWAPSPRNRTQISNLLELAASPLGFVARQVPWLRKLNLGASFHDHLPHHYIAALTPPGVRTEFGD
jgi:hypothetical protein